MRSAWFALLALGWVAGCGPGVASNGASESAATGSSSGAPTQTGATSESEPNGGDFVAFLDVNSDGFRCNPWLQNCPEGTKCMPWANDGGNSWNATKCTPLDPNPRGLYETCTVEDSGVSGIDNCELGAMCWDVDPETLEGTCIGMCLGGDQSPSCEDPDARCSVSGDGVVTLCLPNCDPFEQDCQQGQGCYPINDTFVCIPDGSGPGDGVAGDRCEFLNACDPGLICINADSVAGCPGAEGCCSPVCDLADPAAPAGCPGAPAEGCHPWFDPNNFPAGYGDVGVCALPE